jgi:hypothetical protein
MKTVRDWLKDYEWFPQVEHNANSQNDGRALDVERRSAGTALFSAFVWDDSEEGFDFWSNIHENLQQ